MSESPPVRISSGGTLKLFEILAVKEFYQGALLILSGHLSNRSVALLLRPASGVYIGSGVCIQIGNRYLLATAKHNLTHEGHDLSISDIEVRARGEKYGLPLQLRSMGSASNLDLAWLELEPEIVGRPHLEFVALDESASLSEDNNQQACALLGYPAELAEKPSSAHDPLLLESACVVTLSISAAERRSQTDPSTFCIEWPPRDRSLDGILPLPNGVSGGGVWLLPRHDEHLVWSPERARLVGIETSWWRDYRELNDSRISQTGNYSYTSR